MTVEKGHRPLIDALAKMTEGNTTTWIDHLHAVLWADQSTVKLSTGVSLFRIVCGQEPVLPIDLEILTWRILLWGQVTNTSELLALRARQLEQRDNDIEEAAFHLQRMREKGKEVFDNTHHLRVDELKKADLVLLFDNERQKDMSSSVKLASKWNGPYKIHQAISEKGTYLLAELDGAVLAGTFAGNRLKKFHPRLNAPPTSAQDLMPVEDQGESEDSESDKSDQMDIKEQGNLTTPEETNDSQRTTGLTRREKEDTGIFQGTRSRAADGTKRQTYHQY